MIKYFHEKKIEPGQDLKVEQTNGNVKSPIEIFIDEAVSEHKLNRDDIKAHLDKHSIPTLDIDLL